MWYVFYPSHKFFKPLPSPTIFDLAHVGMICFITMACCISASLYFAPAREVDTTSGDSNFRIPIFKGLPLPLPMFGFGLCLTHRYMMSSWNEFKSEFKTDLKFEFKSEFTDLMSSRQTIVPALTSSRPIFLPM